VESVHIGIINWKFQISSEITLIERQQNALKCNTRIHNTVNLKSVL